MEENIMDDVNMVLWNELKKHRGHKVNIVSYGDWDNPVDICLNDDFYAISRRCGVF